jgi:hypothetical protein
MTASKSSRAFNPQIVLVDVSGEAAQNRIWGQSIFLHARIGVLPNVRANQNVLEPGVFTFPRHSLDNEPVALLDSRSTAFFKLFAFPRLHRIAMYTAAIKRLLSAGFSASERWMAKVKTDC